MFACRFLSLLVFFCSLPYPSLWLSVWWHMYLQCRWMPLSGLSSLWHHYVVCKSSKWVEGKFIARCFGSKQWADSLFFSHHRHNPLQRLLQGTSIKIKVILNAKKVLHKCICLMVELNWMRWSVWRQVYWSLKKYLSF